MNQPNLPIGEPSWLEIGAPTGTITRDFFASLFGWRFVDMENDNHRVESPTFRAGLHPQDAPGIFVYFRVNDLEAAVARVRELGGSVERPLTDDSRFGRFVECKDPQGVPFGLHQP